MLRLTRLLLLLAFALPSFAQFPIKGVVELHIWATAKGGEEAALEKTFKEVFYPAVSSKKGFRSALLMRKPDTPEYTIRLSFDTEKQRENWVASDEHQVAWPEIQSHCATTKYDGFEVIHPK